MQGSPVIKKLHCMLTAVLLLIVAGFSLLYYFSREAPDDELFAQREITDSVYLYITRYKGGGATVSEVYRYYLDGRLQGDILHHLKDRSPFLVAEVANASITGYGAHINVKLSGRVYSFTNSDLFYSEGVAVMPVIDFTVNSK
ncbi:hypothetical protein [Pluralibacter gergoviae]|uniref:Uncharacterized protein n=1 Tax=Pluralibacter gergoviae TaxID=61647 RepID=A0AAW8HHD4_PLUGE|nr:hypothetical protein [Pluralibacter gergoviae]AVR05978.1 hypothetical protein A8H26_11335 [Pluralibacter gergoviae]EKW6620984.1 hypothetical protein [Pluralibacter gergoviae]MDQ2308060.1 hypothetical protein [Pluralibacter gergoviae]SUB72784.1 Uncharacterised protein [Pluralibacter gergoviae]HDS1118018.1 hypothetical protein [Pluralibacter gergoviae]